MDWKNQGNPARLGNRHSSGSIWPTIQLASYRLILWKTRASCNSVSFEIYPSLFWLDRLRCFDSNDISKKSDKNEINLPRAKRACCIFSSSFQIRCSSWLVTTYGFVRKNVIQLCFITTKMAQSVGIWLVIIQSCPSTSRMNAQLRPRSKKANLISHLTELHSPSRPIGAGLYLWASRGLD